MNSTPFPSPSNNQWRNYQIEGMSMQGNQNSQVSYTADKFPFGAPPYNTINIITESIRRKAQICPPAISNKTFT